jgi:hypothetical protein
MYEVYLISIEKDMGRRQISTGGGEEPRWSKDGKQIFYRNGSRWMVVPVDLSGAINIGRPTLHFEGPFLNVGGYSYDVMPDGKRFVVLKQISDVTTTTRLNVVLNWFEELRRKVPN